MSKSHTDTEVINRGAFLSFIIRCTGVVVVLGTNIILARVLSVAEFGRYLYAVQLIGLLTTIGSLGLNQAAARIVAESVVEGRPDVHRQYMYFGVLISFAGGIVLGLMLIAVAYAASPIFPQVFCASLVPFVVPLLLAMILMRFGQEVMRGLKRILASQLSEQVIVPAIIGALAIVMWSSGASLSVEVVLLGQALIVGICAIALFVNGFQLARPNSEPAHIRPNTTNGTREWLSIGIPLALAALATTALSRGDVIILGFLFKAEEVGVYGAAARMSGVMLFGLAAVNAISTPLFSGSWRAKDRVQLEKQVQYATSLAMLIGLPLLMTFLLLPETVLRVFGPHYVEGANVLRILAVGALFNVITGPVGPLMVAANQQHQYMIITLIGTVLSFVLLCVLAIFFGLEGAAAGIVVGIILSNLALAWYVKKSLALWTFPTTSSIREVFRNGLHIVSRLSH